jgi:hypothetical protein
MEQRRGGGALSAEVWFGDERISLEVPMEREIRIKSN